MVLDLRQGPELIKARYKMVPDKAALPLNTLPVDLQHAALRVAVLQDGARLHYAVPLALLRAGVLRLMFSEGFMRRGIKSKLVRGIVGRISSRRILAALQRRADEIPPRLVRTNSFLVVRQRIARSRFEGDEAFYEWSSRAVGKWILRRGIEDSNTLFGFIRNIDPRLCKECRSRGVVTVGDQIIAPAAIEAAEAAIQNQMWPQWQQPDRKPDLALVQQVEQATWAELDGITCGSDYVRQGLMAQGIEGRKIKVFPYPIDVTRYPVPDRSGNKIITVGFVGAVGLRKGAPYFLELANRLRCNHLRFIMVGPVQVPDPIKNRLSQSLELVGRVTREHTVDWMQKFDMLLFPSTCEGAAGAVTEAMATGLPIVASPNSGTPIKDGVEGFIRNYNDIDGLAACIEKLSTDAEMRRNMGHASRKKACEINIDNYGKQLVTLMSDLHATTALA